MPFGPAWLVQSLSLSSFDFLWFIMFIDCLVGAEVNAKEMISGGALWELVRISKECSREDIRSLAHRTLSSSPVFRSEIRRLGIQF